MLLAGDIGGTKTNLAIYAPERGLRSPVVEATFQSGLYPSLEAIVREFLAKANQPRIERASFGVAGPVVAGEAKITNLPWVMSEHLLASELAIPTVRLLNDLEAIANAIPFLEAGDLATLSAGEPAAGGALAVIAPGTGLGEAFITREGPDYAVHPSEGGHADFAPTNPFELGLLGYLLERLPHVSYERVCSGRGLPNLYAYLKATGMAESPALAARLAAASDPTPPIIEAALATVPDALTAATLNAFVAILGAEAGNLALKVLATGGVYLGGGIPPRILPHLQGEPFLRAFRNKGRFTDLLARMPLHVILNPKVALLGAAYHGLVASARRA